MENIAFVVFSFFEGHLDSASCLFSFRMRCCDVVSVACVAITAYFSVYLGAASLGVFIFFEEDDASAFAQYETRTTFVERQ